MPPGRLLTTSNSLFLRVRFEHSPDSQYHSTLFTRRQVRARDRGVLFLPAQVSQDAVDNILILDASNYPDSTSATATDLDVYVEDAFQPLSPGHCGVVLSR